MKKITLVLILSISLFTTTFLQGRRFPGIEKAYENSLTTGTPGLLNLRPSNLCCEEFRALKNFLTDNSHRIQELAFARSLENGVLAAILELTGRSLRGLNLDHCVRLTDFTSIAAHCSNLAKLHLTDTKITNEQLAAILGQLRGSLMELKLHSCGSITDFTPIANCTNLQELNLAQTQITDDKLATILCAIGGNLKVLNLNFCHNLGPEIVQLIITSYKHIRISGASGLAQPVRQGRPRGFLP